MIETEYAAVEWSYHCPHCGNEQGWSSWPGSYYFTKENKKKDHEIVTCNKCRKEFKVKRLDLKKNNQ